MGGARREGGPGGRLGGSPLGRGGCWPAALLAASILVSSNLPIHGQDIAILLKPSNPIEEGERISLSPQVNFDRFGECQWFRENELIMSHERSEMFLFSVGEANSERETMGPDCSLYITGAVEEDSGTYTVVMIGRDGVSSARGDVKLQVAGKLSKAVLQPQKVFVEENGNVYLKCIASGSSMFTISWFKDGQPVPKTEVLFNRNRTLILRQATRDEAGSYTCVASNPFSNVMSNPSEIIVTYSSGETVTPWKSQDNTMITVGISVPVLAIIFVILLIICLRCKCCWRRQAPRPPPTLTPSAPPPPPPTAPSPLPPPYENVCPFGPTGPWVTPENVPGNRYETLQHGVRSGHEEVMQGQINPQGSFL